MLRPAAIAALCLAAGLAAAPRAARVIGQKDKRFSEKEVTIAAGDSLVFVNDDEVTHNVFSSTEGLKFNLKRQPPGARAGVPFATPGKAQVRCAFHPTMKLTVVVE